MQAKVPPSDNGSARDYFERTLPALIQERRALFDRFGGTLTVYVEGEGAWTVRFGDHRAPNALTREGDLDADCVASFSGPGFSRVLEGTADAPPAVIGDPKLLARLGQISTTPGRGALGARLAANDTHNASSNRSIRGRRIRKAR